MVAEYEDALDVAGLTGSFGYDLADCSIVVESTETGDVLFLDLGCEVTKDECICVCRIGNYQTFDIRLGSAQRQALLHEDPLVRLQQILTLHSRLARKTPQKDNQICPLEHLLGFVPVSDLRGERLTDLTRG